MYRCLVGVGALQLKVLEYNAEAEGDDVGGMQVAKESFLAATGFKDGHCQGLSCMHRTTLPMGQTGNAYKHFAAEASVAVGRPGSSCGG